MITIQLKHGRNTKDEQLQDWGFDGPDFSELDKVVIRKTGDIIAFRNGEQAIEILLVEDLYCYDGKYYGDLIIGNENEGEIVFSIDNTSCAADYLHLTYNTSIRAGKLPDFDTFLDVFNKEIIIVPKEQFEGEIQKLVLSQSDYKGMVELLLKRKYGLELNDICDLDELNQCRLAGETVDEFIKRKAIKFDLTPIAPN